jgi:hypothetical protein
VNRTSSGPASRPRSSRSGGSKGGIRYVPVNIKLRDARKKAKPPETQFWRRAYVRAVFAWIEASTNWFALAASRIGRAAVKSGRPGITALEECALNDESPRVDDDGKVSGRILRIPFLARFHLSRRLYARAYDPSWGFPPYSDQPDCIQRARVVRDRVTHPAVDRDVEISESECGDVEHADKFYEKVLDSLPRKSPPARS